MSPFALLRVALLLVPALRADFFPQTFHVLAPDSAEVRRLYGAHPFSNPSSRTQVRVLEKGVLRFEADTILSEGREGNSAKVGMVLPFRRDRGTVDLSLATGFSLDIRLSAIPSAGLVFSFDSPGYGGSFQEEGKVLETFLVPAVLPAPGTWKTIQLPMEGMQPPAWWTPEDDFPGIDSLLKIAKGIGIAPRVAYSLEGTREGVPCTACVAPTQPELVVEVRNLAVVGIPAPGANPSRFQCEDLGRGVLIDDFQDGDSLNPFRGSWFAASDTSSNAARMDDSGRGTSEVRFEVQAGGNQEPGFARFRAHLRKEVAQTPRWRPYAGWASLSTNFERGEGALWVEALYAFSFQLRLERQGNHTPGILFKLLNPGIAPEQAHEVLIPTVLIDPASPLFLDRICIPPENLSQPLGVKNPIAFNSSKIERLIWEARIDDHIDSSIVQDSLEFLLSDVRIHCFDCWDAVRSRPGRKTFPVSYASGRLTVQPPAGYERISVVSSSGRVAARFTGRVQGKRLDLERGTWHVVARDAKGESMVRTIAVLR